jgi:hypothetical protein
MYLNESTEVVYHIHKHLHKRIQSVRSINYAVKYLPHPNIKDRIFSLLPFIKRGGENWTYEINNAVCVFKSMLPGSMQTLIQDKPHTSNA